MLVSKLSRGVRDYLLISLGLLIFVAGWCVFILPNHLVGGGLTGLSALIHYATGIEVSYVYFVLNVILLAVSFKVVGKDFGVKTIYAIIFCTIAFKLIPMCISPEFIKEIAIDNGKMLCAVFGGIMSALGVSMAINRGGNSGGTEIIALIVNKYYNISTGAVIVMLDIIIISSSLFVPSDASWGTRFADVVYGFITSAVFSIALDFFITGAKQSVQMLIFSDKYKKIADRIVVEEDHGASVFDAQGWYAKSQRRVLLVVVRKTDMNRILEVIKEEDPNAFISVGSVQGVYGMGFEQIKK